jgi:small-conductance mechanosensitive channel
MVRHHHDKVYATSASVVRWIATAAWILAALQLFSLRSPLFGWASAFLTQEHYWGSLKYNFGSIVAFPITVWAAFAISRLVRFALEEDVYPNLHLPRGIPYAVSTMVHYAILLLGFFVALSAMGIDLSNYAVLAGAFGVGLGFGLQNIMNNFISGLILLFERPIKVGDTLQIDANTIGRVERIGIRASVILLTNGSELIMPNGNLISNPVTNWTLSNCERLIEIPVSIAPKANARRALDLLIESAKANAAVLKNPPPQAVILSLAAASTALKLRCWVDSEEDWMKVTSEITLALQAALEKENIALA